VTCRFSGRAAANDGQVCTDDGMTGQPPLVLHFVAPCQVTRLEPADSVVVNALTGNVTDAIMPDRGPTRFAVKLPPRESASEPSAPADPWAAVTAAHSGVWQACAAALRGARTSAAQSFLAQLDRRGQLHNAQISGSERGYHHEPRTLLTAQESSATLRQTVGRAEFLYIAEVGNSLFCRIQRARSHMT
jgi:hypothetical protein